MTLAGASAAFTPHHILAAALASRASSRIGPRVAGLHGQLAQRIEVAELRVHEGSALAHKTLAETAIHAKTGANIVGQWRNDALSSPPAPDHEIEPGTILVATGSAESIASLSHLSRPITQQGRLVVVGYSDVAQKLVEILTDVDEEVCAIHNEDRPRVDVVGDVFDRTVLERASASQARPVIVALETDNSMLFAVTHIRSFAPETPIIASVDQTKYVERAQRAGADFALSVSQVAGQILVHLVLGETVSLQPRIKLVKTLAGRLAGRDLSTARIREKTGCTVVAVDRGGELLMDLPASFGLNAEDELYVCGTSNGLRRYRRAFGAARQ